MYSICFDNSFSTISSKLVNVEILLYSNEDDDRWQMSDSFTYMPPDEAYADITDNIKVSLPFEWPYIL